MKSAAHWPSTAVITDLESVAPTQSVPIVCEAPDDELLLVDWLNALVYEMATRKMLFSRFMFASTTIRCTRRHGESRSRWRDINRLSK